MKRYESQSMFDERPFSDDLKGISKFKRTTNKQKIWFKLLNYKFLVNFNNYKT